MITTFNNIKKFKNMSSSQLLAFNFKSKNIFKLEELLYRKLTPLDNGIEVGTVNYIKKSEKIFMKAKALQSYNFFPVINNETSEFIKPNAFKFMDLKEGDIIISKDSNIGEACILEKDYPNVMLSNALYKLPILEKKYYILSFIKSDYFKQQLDILAPRGATIRHAGKKFLDCFIPFPSDERVVDYIERLTKCILKIEKTIDEKDELIINLINDDLKNNCVNNDLNLDTLKFSELKKIGRYDVGIFSDEYKIINNYIENYKYGNRKLEEFGYEITRGQNLQISNIGKSVYSKYKINDSYYDLILSNSITDNMTFRTNLFLGSKKTLKTIEYGDIIFTCRGNLGRCFVNCSGKNKMITNIDNVHICNKKNSIEEKITICCFLHYLKKKNYLRNISIQGSGADSFTKYHFDMINIPNFSKELQLKLSILYNNTVNDKFSIDNFIENIGSFGLFQLEKIKEIISKEINAIFFDIMEDNKVEIDNSFNIIINELRRFV